MKQYSRIKSLLKQFCYVVLVLLCIVGCNHSPSTPPTSNSNIDSLLIQAKDSLFHNNPYSKSHYKTALSLAKDSDNFYKVLSDYCSYYFAINAYDTAYILTNQLMKYANRQPLSPRSCRNSG